eukprot:TRINITY_DN20494_c0_g1_i1.p1 TRINITY_DN20494_c0_g1~~TRINITY_DN20494_c0_g1_i1.p1  ORF type:complete len:260 (+),score=32.26 TRINITY_DN20494_c0_g1_i1:278-1057(+)
MQENGIEYPGIFNVQLQLSFGGLLRRLLACVSEFTEVANLDCTPTGIQIQALDASHVAFVCVEMPDTGFCSYRCNATASLGINLKNLVSILHSAKDGMVVRLEANLEKLGLYIHSTTSISHFALHLIDIDAEHMALPDEPVLASFTMPTTEFLRIAELHAVLGPTVTITVSPSAAVFVSLSQSRATGSTTITLGTPAFTLDKFVEPTTLSIASTYLLAVAQANLATCVSLSLGEVVLTLEFDMARFGKALFLIAAKLEQ